MRLCRLYGFFSLLLIVGYLTFYTSVGVSKTNKLKIAAPKSEEYDVFLVAGQSNTCWGTGYDPVKDQGSPGIYQLGRGGANDMKIIEAKEPLQHFSATPGKIGFALTFTKLYQAFINHERNILIIPCGMDWTGFADSSWGRGDCLYRDALYRTNFVLKNYPTSNLKAILWHQGEKDVANKKFQQNLDSMIVGFRKDISGDNTKLPFILGGMVPFWVEKSQVRTKHQKILKETKNRLPYIGYADPYSPFRIKKPNDMLDTVHFNADGQREMGKRYFEEYKKITKGKKK